MGKMYALLLCYHLLQIILATPIIADIQQGNQSVSSKNSREKLVCSRGLKWLGKRVCIDDDYEKENPPHESSNKVYNYIENLEINDINEDEKRFDISVMHSMCWVDSRIALVQSPSNINDSTPFTMYHYDQISSGKIWSSLWTPDDEVTIENIREATLKPDPFFMLIIFPAKYSQELLGTNEVSVMVTRKIQMNLFCNFKFKDFPLDTQRCLFQVTNKDARYLQLIFLLKNDKNNSKTSKNFTKDGFDITAKLGQGEDCDGGATSCIEVEFILHRIRSTFVFQYYMPCCAIVFVSQISFIITPSSIPGRLGLLATQFLTLTNLFINHMVRLRSSNIFQKLIKAISDFILIIFY